MVMTSTIFETFWDNVDKSGGPDSCWPWQRARVPIQRRNKAVVPRGGYGSLQVPGRRGQQGAHRVAYELTHGPIPAGMLVRHSCDNPPCCNPSHLLVGTQLDNMRDKVERRRQGNCVPDNPEHGVDRYNAKLTDDAVREMRADRAAGMKWREIEDKYGVSKPTAWSAVVGITWKHVA